MKLWILGSLLTLSLGACDRQDNDDVYEIRINNNSPERLTASYSKSYPDTIPTNETIFSACPLIYPDSFCFANDRLGWRSRFSQNPQNKLIFFISNYDTLVKYGPEFTFSNPAAAIKKTIIISLDSISQANWTLSYP